MIDSTTLTVIDQGSAGTAQLVIEADAGGQAQKALQYALFESRKGSGSVAFQRKDVFAGPENGLDALADGSEMQPLADLVLALGPDVNSPKIHDCGAELLACISLVGQQGFPATAPAAPEKLQSHLTFIALGRGKAKRSGSAVGGEDGMQAYSPEVAGMTGAVSVVRDVRKGGAKNGFPASGALHRGRVDEQKIICETGTLPGKDDQEPLEKRGRTAPALEVGGLCRNLGEERGKTVLSHAQEATVRRDAHDGLSHTQGDDLGIGGSAAGVSLGLRQKIIGCAINDGAEGVEVGVHRGLQADGVAITVGFGLSASNPFFSAMFVESII